LDRICHAQALGPPKEPEAWRSQHQVDARANPKGYRHMYCPPDGRPTPGRNPVLRLSIAELIMLQHSALSNLLANGVAAHRRREAPSVCSGGLG